MAEPTVPVPVSLIRMIDRDLGENAWHPEDCPGSHPAYCTCAVGQARRALRALLSQPTPTAEPDQVFRCDDCGAEFDYDHYGDAQSHEDQHGHEVPSWTVPAVTAPPKES